MLVEFWPLKLYCSLKQCLSEFFFHEMCIWLFWYCSCVIFFTAVITHSTISLLKYCLSSSLPVTYLIFFLHQLSASLLIFLLLVFRFGSVYIMFSLSRVILLIDSALFHNSFSCHLSFPFLNVSPLSPYFFLFVSCCILRCCGCRLVICAQCLAVSISTGMCLLPFLLQLTTESPKIIYIGVYEFTAFCKY